MINFSFSQATLIVHGRLHGPEGHFVGMTQDSRKLQPGQLYAALPGERVDGHAFIDAAEQAGASVALVSSPVECGISQIEVADVSKAMGQLAAAWRDQLNLSVVGITGSNGKTTVKNMLAAIVVEHSLNNNKNANALMATPGNYNNEIGLPLTLAKLSSQHLYAILEMGCAKPGDIAYLASLAKPCVGVVTNASAAHLKGLGSVAGVAATKGELFIDIGADGTAVINRDDRFFHVWLDQARPARVLSFGQHVEADVRLSDDGQILTPDGAFDLRLQLPGLHNQLNALAATAAALALEIDLATIAQGLSKAQAEPGRLQLHSLGQGLTLIDDSYNANPASMRAALQVLAEQQGSRWLVVGDMAELADQAEAEHAELGISARKTGIDKLFTLGKLAAVAAREFGPAGQAFDDVQSLIFALQSQIKRQLPQPVTCLIKGSRSMAMERVVAALTKPLSDPLNNRKGTAAC